jgi:hypothetical protein
MIVVNRSKFQKRKQNLINYIPTTPPPYYWTVSGKTAYFTFDLSLCTVYIDMLKIENQIINSDVITVL